ncbi:alpha-glucuronidase family glycosyl hydrolase [Ferdinandcohnia quinoae]|uniref:Alpha glucuronidase N-terminal domain-containing protein n=1 Tax=Fredinandcohnia quinoae TaxID=2918902 RepID=A0AAW5E4L3_9BACI|nr:alpha-glucuronidase family glycosyl hydrolase [Fredinandcohnia sp. SECRCQ15]MCH1626489.1 hypothetical protein [Fredinandcohnia sp. SECRCQ15]
METIIYFNQQQTILFAVEELRRYLRKAGHLVQVYHASYKEKVIEGQNIILMLEEEYRISPYFIEENPLQKDGFAIYEDKTNTYIIGKEARSILYGIYYYCEKVLGYQWVTLIEEPPEKPQRKPLIKSWDIHNPIFSRRGNIIETVNDPIYLHQLIDWGVKNRLNEFFFTFFLWDEVKASIKEALVQRGVHVTLGGHSLDFLLKGEDNEQPNFFAGNHQLQHIVIQKIIDICKETPIITRLSLWPEDIGISEKEFADFLPTYVTFMERLKAALKVNQLNVKVEHIVYNAGLSWNMLERKESTEASTDIDVLFAYWGRDYSRSIDSPSPQQKRAHHALVDWRKQTRQNHTSMTVLEYYSDSFMLSELFPPLLNRMQKDILDYKNEGVDGVLNLIVPYHAKRANAEMKKKYPWKWINQLNNFFYAGLVWGRDYNELLEQFFAIFGENKDQYRSIVLELENIVAKHSKWNVPLFPARVVDPEKAQLPNSSEAIIILLEEILDFLNSQEANLDQELLALQTTDNYHAFSSNEMLLIYFHYVKKVAHLCKQGWNLKIN